MSRAQLTLSKSSTRTERGGSENSCARTKSKQGGGGARSVGDEEERQLDDSLRPRSLAEFIGQQPIKQVLGMSIEAARKRGEPLDLRCSRRHPASARPHSLISLRESSG